MGGKGGFLAVVGFLGETLPIVIFMFAGFLFILKGVGAGCIAVSYTHLTLPTTPYV